MKKFKEDENGKYFWVDCGAGSGFWQKEEDEDLAKERVPYTCPACFSILDNWSIEKYFHRNGVCSDCSIRFLEGKTIENGFFKSRDEKVLYCKEQIKAHTKRLEEMKKLENS